MSTLDDIKATFFIECRELLEDMEAGLIEMSEGSGDAETVNAVFRAAHSIKGGAGAFAFNDLVSFAHRFETTLDEVRGGRLEANGEVMAVFLRSADKLADLVAAAEEERQVDAEDTASLLADLAALTGDEIGEEAEAEEFDDGGFQPMTLDFGGIDGAEPPTEESGPYKVEFTPHPGLLNRGNEPALLIRALGELGELDCQLDLSQIGTLDSGIDETALKWTITLTTEVDESEIREVFEFVEDDCDLTISRAEGDSHAPFDLPPQAEEAPPPPVEEASVMETSEETTQSEPASESDESTAPRTDEATPSSPSTAKPDAQAPKAAGDNKARGVGSIRVDLDRVDRLINLVGELVVNQAMLSQSVVDAGLAASSAVATGLDEFKNLTREVQDSVMAIRAQPVRSLFQRMSRIVREAAAATGKSVRLRTEGEATEIDKTVIDLLADPLTHMIRNAIDHGLETPEKRSDLGKTPEGIVWLTAAHRSGRVVIEIADDGAGINRERVREIAESKGLISTDANLSPNDIDNLLFLPGFSTAKEVSNLSGRGVGMDVVKQAIQKLGGRISISSKPGHGSTFSISLPLTLAVLDGMIVSVDEQTLVVPLTSVVETLRPDAQSVHSLGRDGTVIKVRDAYVPVVDIGRTLGFADQSSPPDREVFLLIEGEQAGQRALAVDKIVEQRQVVIKSLEDNYGHVEGVAAATILGNGRIALILDPDSLVPTTISQNAA